MDRTAQSQTLLVSVDPRISADVRRLAAMGGVAVAQLPGAPVPAAAVERATLLLLDAATAVDLATQAPVTTGARGPDTVVVTDDGEQLEVWRAAALLGAAVMVLPADEGRLLDRIASAGAGRGAAPVIAVVPGAGGAGASVAAAGLALTVARTQRAALLDVDPAAGGVDLLAGAEAAAGARWQELRSLRGAVSADALAEVLPHSGDLLLVSGSRDGPETVSAQAISAVLPPLRRLAPVVVADLPGRPTEAAAVVAAACAMVFVVAVDDVRAATSTARVADWAAGLCADVRLVVRTRPRAQIRADDVAAAVGLQPTVLPTEPGIAVAADLGRLAGSLSRSRLGAWAAGVAAELTAAAPSAAVA